MSGIVGLFTVCRFGEAGAASLAGRQISLENWISLAGLPILCVLFLEAMLLRQSVMRMGNGLLTRGWVALVCGVVLTGAGEMALWVIPHYSFTQPLVMFGALIRLPIAAAFALLPAFQVAAQCRAMKAGRAARRRIWLRAFPCWPGSRIGSGRSRLGSESRSAFARCPNYLTSNSM